MKTRELLVVSLILVLVSCWAGPVTLSGQKNAQKKAAQQAEKNKQLELALAGLLNTGTTACQVPENTELRDDLSGYENGILKFRKEAGPKLKKGMMLRLQPTEKIPTGFLGKIQETEATPNDTLAVTAEPVPLDKICSEFSAAEDYDSLSRQVNFSNGKISIQEEVREGSITINSQIEGEIKPVLKMDITQARINTLYYKVHLTLSGTISVDVGTGFTKEIRKKLPRIKKTVLIKGIPITFFIEPEIVGTLQGDAEGKVEMAFSKTVKAEISYNGLKWNSNVLVEKTGRNAASQITGNAVLKGEINVSIGVDLFQHTGIEIEVGLANISEMMKNSYGDTNIASSFQVFGSTKIYANILSHNLSYEMPLFSSLTPLGSVINFSSPEITTINETVIQSNYTTINIGTNRPTRATISYGVEADLAQSKTSVNQNILHSLQLDTLLPDTTYFYRANVEANGKSTASAVRSFRTLQVSPPAPSSLTGCNVQNNDYFTCAWLPSATATSYKLYASCSDLGNPQCSERLVASVPGTTTYYAQPDQLGNLTFVFRVVAVNAGGSSPYSQPYSLPGPLKPAPASAVSATYNTSWKQVENICWNNSALASTYKIEIQTSQSSYRNLIENNRDPNLSGRTCSYSYFADPNFEGGLATIYVTAKNRHGSASEGIGYVNIISPTPPPVPSYFYASAWYNSIDLTWSYISSASHYEIRRCDQYYSCSFLGRYFSTSATDSLYFGQTGTFNYYLKSCSSSGSCSAERSASVTVY